MKKFMIPLLILGVALVSSCKNEKKTDNNDKIITISGSISNADRKDLILQRLTPKTVTAIDTVSLKDDGTFNLTDTSSKSEFYRLVIDNEAIFIIANVKDKIKVTAKAPLISRNYTVEGSKESQLVKDMNERLMETADSLQKLNMLYQEAAKEDVAKAQALGNKFNGIATELFENEKAYLTDLINNNEESLIIYLALFQSFGRASIFTYPEDKEMFNSVLSKLETHHAENPFTAALKSDIQKMEMAQQQQANQQGGFLIGDIAPDITLNSPEGKSISLHSLRGQYVLLDFWASWCRPCRMENPNLVSTYNKYKNNGFTIFQVSLDKTKEDWVNGIANDNLNGWYHVSDLKYWNSAAARQYGVQSIPSNFLLNPEGKIIDINLRGEELGAKLNEIFKK